MLKITSSTISASILAIFLAVSALAPTQKTMAQLGDLGDLIVDEGRVDAQLLFSEYLKPFANGFGAGVNSGWVDRARSHGLLGFHVKVNFSAAIVPDIDQSFLLDEIGLTRLQLADPNRPETPTFSGSSSSDARLVLREQGLDLAEFTMPPGTGFGYIMTPMIQAGLGLPNDTDVMIRFVPPFSFLDYGEMYLYGIGVKHELNQWLPGGAFLPLTFSVMAGYTSFGTSAGLRARPTDFDPQNDLDPKNLGGPESDTWSGQEIQFSTDAWTANLIVGKSIPMLSVYGGVGVEGSTTNVSVEGDFPYYEPVFHESEYRRSLDALTDPLEISFDGANRFRAMAGVRISLPLLTFNVDYTYADYSIVTAGIGVSLR